MRKSIFLSVVLLVFLFTLNVSLAADYEGAGTVNDPYRIQTVEQLQGIRDGLDKSYILMDDLSISDGTWLSIGNYTHPFSGNFNGNNKTITFAQATVFTTDGTSPAVNARDENGDGYGLFGNVKPSGGTPVRIENVHLVVLGDLTNGDNRIFGTLLGAGGFGYVHIINCHVEGSSSIIGKSDVGGLVGLLQYGRIDTCSSSFSVSASDSFAGGLVGCFRWIGVIYQSYSESDVSAAGTNAGGLAGFFGGLENGISIPSTLISGSYASGTVRSSNQTGGLVGSIYDGSIVNSYSNATVIGGSSTGNTAGGLVGYSLRGNISQTYSSGPVTGNVAGGLVGAVSTNNILKSFYNSDTTGCSDSGKGIAKTTTELQMLSTFSDWSIEEYGESFRSKSWYLKSGSFPELMWKAVILIDDTTPFKWVGDGQVHTDAAGNSFTWFLNHPYKLVGDIQIEETVWKSIGNTTHPFNGWIEGDFYTITFTQDVTLTNDGGSGDGYGLFGNFKEPSVNNLTLIVRNMTADNTVNGGVGPLIGAAETYGAVENSSVEGYDASNTVKGNYNVGGMIGKFDRGFMRHDSSTVNVVAVEDNAGGLVGNFRGTAFYNNYAAGSVTAKNNAGGLAGQLKEYDNLYFCYATGSVTATQNNAGGLIGLFAGTGNSQYKFYDNVALNKGVKGVSNVGKVIGGFDTAKEPASVSGIYAWENMTGNFDSLFGNEDVSTADVWNTSAGTGGWSSFNPIEWDLSTNPKFLLPIFVWQEGVSADASHLVQKNQSNGGGSGTGNATISGPQPTSPSSAINETNNTSLPPAENNTAPGYTNEEPAKPSYWIFVLLAVVIIAGVALYLKKRQHE